jgi:hypothetical protein
LLFFFFWRPLDLACIGSISFIFFLPICLLQVKQSVLVLMMHPWGYGILKVVKTYMLWEVFIYILLRFMFWISLFIWSLHKYSWHQ